MKQLLILILAIIYFQAKAQDSDRFQPDSIYRYCKVKRIFVYGHSFKDLSKIIDLDVNGHIIRLVNYDESYDRKTRARKGIFGIRWYKYDSENKLIEVIDSDRYVHPNGETDYTCFFYNENGVLKSSTHYNGKYTYDHTDYSASPIKSIIECRHDSIIFYKRTQEYDRDFYEKRSYGFSLESTLKTVYVVHGTDTSSYQYSDDKDMQRLEFVNEYTNHFNSKGQLISSEENQRFMVNPGTWRTFHDIAMYKYFENGLLKWINGYSGKSFKYEFYK